MGRLAATGALTGGTKSAAAAAAKGLKVGGRVRWSDLGRAAFALPDPNIIGTFHGSASVSGFGTVLWNGRASADMIDLQCIEALA